MLDPLVAREEDIVSGLLSRLQKLAVDKGGPSFLIGGVDLAAREKPCERRRHITVQDYAAHGASWRSLTGFGWWRSAHRKLR